MNSPQYNAFNPFRAPDWRWQRVRELLAIGGRAGRYDDDHVRTALAYGRALARAQSNAARTHVRLASPDLTAARRIYEEAGATRDELESRLLASQPDVEIAAAMDVPDRAIASYENLYFAVRDEQGQVSGHDCAMLWLAAQPWDRESPPDGIIWRYIGLVGGSAVLTALLDEVKGRCPAPTDGPSLSLRARLMLQLHSMPSSNQKGWKKLISEVRRAWQIRGGVCRRDREQATLALHLTVLERFLGHRAGDSNSLRPAPTATRNEASLGHPTRAKHKARGTRPNGKGKRETHALAEEIPV